MQRWPLMLKLQRSCSTSFFGAQLKSQALVLEFACSNSNPATWRHPSNQLSGSVKRTFLSWKKAPANVSFIFSWFVFYPPWGCRCKKSPLGVATQQSQLNRRYSTKRFYSQFVPFICYRGKVRKTPVTGAEADDGSQVICREKEGGKEIKDQMFSFAPFPPILLPLLTLFKENEVVVTFRKATPPPPWACNPPTTPTPPHPAGHLQNLEWCPEVRSNRGRGEAARKERVSEKRVRREVMLLDHFIGKSLSVTRLSTLVRGGGRKRRGEMVRKARSKGMFVHVFLLFLYSSFSSPCVMT